MTRNKAVTLTDEEANRIIERRRKIEIPHNLYDIGEEVSHVANREECGVIDSITYNLRTKTYVYGVTVGFGGVFYENERNLKLIEI